MLKKITNIINQGTDFQQLFFDRELETLSDKANWNIRKLAIILFLTLLALGFSFGGLQQLEKRMANPFTNWVNLPISGQVAAKRANILTTFENQIYLDSFFLANFSEYAVTRKRFINMEDGLVYDKKGRTVDENSELLKKILSKGDNLLTSESANISLFEENPCGIIVKKSMLEDLGYTNPLGQKQIVLEEDDGRAIFLDILAIVEELPNRSDFICHPILYNMLINSWSNTGFLAQENSFNTLQAISKKPLAETESFIKETFKNQKIVKIKAAPYVLNTAQSHYLYQIIFHPIPAISTDSVATFYKKLNGGETELNHFIPYFEYSCNANFGAIKSPHHIAFNFAQLDKVRAFKNFMFNTYEVEIDMNQVESKENFSLVSNLTRLTVLALILFSILSIWLFINSLLKIHLERIKPNLGTFKAFGLSNKFLTSAYLKIIGVFMLLAIVLAFVGATIIALLNDLLNMDTAFDLFNRWIFLTLLFLGIISLLFSKQTIQRILVETPGDLIYGRS